MRRLKKWIKRYVNRSLGRDEVEHINEYFSYLNNRRILWGVGLTEGHHKGIADKHFRAGEYFFAGGDLKNAEKNYKLALWDLSVYSESDESKVFSTPAALENYAHKIERRLERIRKLKQNRERRVNTLDEELSYLWLFPIIFFLIGILLLSFTITGNTILNLSDKTNSQIGISLIVFSFIVGLFLLKERKRVLFSKL